MWQDEEQKKKEQAVILFQQFLTLSTANMFQVKIYAQQNNNPLIFSLFFSFSRILNRTRVQLHRF